MARKFTVTVGERVAYSVQFLRNIGMSHSDMAHARGVVIEVKELGPGSETQLARITWDKNADMPGRVNVTNLAKVGPNVRFANCD
jgi:hypothetical protein